MRIESQAEPIPGYRLIERLGGGGFGEVWKAEAPGGLHKVDQLGMHMLKNLRSCIVQRFGSTSQLPNLQLLLLDTGSSSSALSPNETIVAPLSRPSHYLKKRDGRPKIETWLDERMLYRIPRSQMTAGVRALGRLAFFDRYRMIVKRLQKELDASLNPNTLAQAGRQTNLGVRRNRPRVYVVADLAGGTGSGMFLDLAYTVRHQLKQIGYDKPDVVGLFLLPPATGKRTADSVTGQHLCGAHRA